MSYMIQSTKFGHGPSCVLKKKKTMINIKPISLVRPIRIPPTAFFYYVSPRYLYFIMNSGNNILVMCDAYVVLGIQFQPTRSTTLLRSSATPKLPLRSLGMGLRKNTH
uniref:Uncharacterized protein n=1 Tax=Brassica campestris TaxID=3711 RepID=A0A3P5Y3F0_BRACM|nr:unnamed protein product [Brassica rapa]